MNWWIVILPASLLCLGVVGFFTLRFRQRYWRNLQRGLSMVPLKIHLPPISEDVEAKTRDQRDVVEENISKATILYNLLISTAQKKGFKTHYYGQQHFGFEIINEDGFTCFYAVAPQSLVPLLRQAVMSTYRGARLEEVEEYNLFKEETELEYVTGAELILKEHFAYPVATYLESRQDIMKVVLGALSELSAKESAGIQVLLRPARANWTKEAQAVSKKISDPEKGNNFF